MLNIFVLGGTGFIGSKIVNMLSDDNQIVVMHRSDDTKKNKSKNIIYTVGDVLNYSSLDKSFPNNIDIVINLIGQWNKNEKFISESILCTKNITKIMKKRSVNKLIHFSTSLVYGGNCDSPRNEEYVPKPESTYAKAKYETEKIFLSSGLKTIILRLGNVFGKNQQNGLLGIINNCIINDLPVKIPLIEKIRNFVYIDDVLLAIDKLLDSDFQENTIFNVGGDNISIKELIAMIEELLNHKFKKEYINLNDENMVQMDCSKIEDEIGFKPNYDLKSSLERFFK